MAGQDSGLDGSVILELVFLQLLDLTQTQCSSNETPVLQDKAVQGEEENGQILVLPTSKEPAYSEFGYLEQR